MARAITTKTVPNSASPAPAAPTSDSGKVAMSTASAVPAVPRSPSAQRETRT